jgi:methyl-accepting chemotaxis protein
LIRTSVEKTEMGVQITEQVTTSFQEIRNGVHQVTDLITGITDASREQAQSAAHISTAVEQMDAVTQAAAGNAEETASAAEELNAQSREMLKLIKDLETMVMGSREKGFEKKKVAPPALPRKRPTPSTPLRPAPGQGRAHREILNNAAKVERILGKNFSTFSKEDDW